MFKQIMIWITALTMSTFTPVFGETVESIPTPPDYQRVTVTPHSFAEYLRTFTLKPQGTAVHYYNGQIKPHAFHAAILDIDVGEKNLQQCADAIMRLRGEYLYSQQRYDDIHFNFTNGFKADYARYRQGDRVGIEGNKTWWKTKVATPDSSYTGFRQYMNLVFTYAGTLSLAKELRPVKLKDIQVGDVFIQPGSPGHAVIVMDVAKKGESTVMLLAQSYMPAQDIHIIKNLHHPRFGAWYEVGQGSRLETPEWTFSWGDLKRFETE